MFKLNTILSLYLLLFFVGTAGADSRIVKDVRAEGSCAVVGMSAEQSQHIALQRARSAAIEEAAGVHVTSNVIVTNDRLAVDFIRTYSKGFIVSETVEWLPLGQYQKDRSTPPIPEYKVKITADVYIAEKKIEPIGLKAAINKKTFVAGDSAVIKIDSERDAKIAIFNITADDKVVMLFPNLYENSNIVSNGRSLIFPSAASHIDLVIKPLKGHKRDAEAVFVVAMDTDHKRKFIDMFKPFEPIEFSRFFRVYSEIADYSEDVILAYEVSE